MIPVKSGKRSVFNSERRVTESFTWSLTTKRAEKISGCVKRCLKMRRSLRSWSVGSFVRSFVGRSSGRSVVLSFACSFLRFFIRWSVRFSACLSIVRLFVAHYWSFFIHCSSFIVRLLPFVHSFVLRSIEKSVVPVFVQSVDRSLCRSIGQFAEITKLTSTQVKM